HSATATFTFVAVQGTMSLNVPSSETVNELTAVTFTVSGTDSSLPAPSLAISASQLPTGATFSASQGTSPSGTFTWTPSETQAGVFTVTFTLTDGVTSTTQSVTITVIAVTPPIITAPGAETATVGKSLSFTISASNPSLAGEPIVLSATGLEKNMAFDPSTGVFTFTPDQSQMGKTFTINFTATYGDKPSVSSTRQVTIKAENSASTSGGACPTCIFGTGLSVTVWLLIVGALIGVMSSIALLNIKARAELTARKKTIRLDSPSRSNGGRQPARRPGSNRATSSRRSPTDQD
ncbi:MAG TPA: putative Ig domain-containing protein, partial [Candidatus Bathyarchaeia archaeon]|nr:putative Ig domain-containing protein [Candidatus Bathyarchaeia archaeon]